MSGPSTPVLSTERLLLRGWIDSDREPFARMNDDPVVMEHFPNRPSRAESDAFIDRIQRAFSERGFGLWAVERRSDGRFLGFTGLWEPTFDAAFTPAVEIGWRLAADAWGAGYATEAAREVLRSGSSSSVSMRSCR